MFDKVLGELTQIQDESPLEGYTGSLNTSEGPIDLTILLEGGTLDEALSLARALAGRIDAHLALARRHLVAAFLSVHNADYLERDEAALTNETFLKKANLPSVTIDLDGEINFTFGHEDLLWGHWMGVSIHPDGTVDTDVAG